MTKEQKNVEEFMRTFGQDVKTQPDANIPLAVRELRAKIILEEALETINKGLGLKVYSKNGKKQFSLVTDEFVFNERGDVDLVELADGLADLHYVGYCGTAVAFGIDMEPIFEDVHNSNMSKIWSPDDLAAFIKKDEEPEVEVTQVGDGFIVKREDGKVLKPPTYQQVKIKDLLDEQSK